MFRIDVDYNYSWLWNIFYGNLIASKACSGETVHINWIRRVIKDTTLEQRSHVVLDLRTKQKRDEKNYVMSKNSNFDLFTRILPLLSFSFFLFFIF